jgi:ketosteroid isomerase-like protein
MEDWEIRTALDLHWAASNANDFETEHQIYRDDAVLEYPQSGERIRGRRNIQASREAQPNRKSFSVRRILGAADLWVTEYVLTYDGRPSDTVSIMEFRDGKVARETQYWAFCDHPRSLSCPRHRSAGAACTQDRIERHPHGAWRRPRTA